MEERNYYLGFSLTSGIGPKRFSSLLKYFKTAEKAWSASETELKNAGLGNSFVQNLIKFRQEFAFDDGNKRNYRPLRRIFPTCHLTVPV